MICNNTRNGSVLFLHLDPGYFNIDIQKKYERVISHVEEIDRLLNTASKGWKTARMNKVDLTILRLAVYEMKWDDEVPEGVAINEAVELAKKFGGDSSSSFVNGVLGKVAKQES